MFASTLAAVKTEDKNRKVSTPSRILLVDDDLLVLATLAERLNHAGYEIVTASSGPEALELAEKFKPKLAIVDVRMPQMSSIELGHRLKLPLLYLATYNDSDLAQAALEAGAMGYLVKPLDVPQILPMLEAALLRGEELLALRESESRLNQALAIERKTRTAVGILMERHRLDRQEAFDLLRRHARSQRKKVADTAEAILLATETLNLKLPSDAH